ncbi:hypothetical protein [Tenggerimyces flavus]|uniref:Lipoprotein n=1 Tax=Tenggerimyces flavus TaxID=1708749 RepID=A0ABV7YJA1_9ACTN|nr:hypothetical protein [Tenggerimyces flavus]MBM7787297.1 hypothetical protein [Tenggerimyces flavus]
MKVRQLVAASLTAASVLAATTACQPDAIGPSPTPTVSETSSPPSPTPSASPTPSFGASEQRAVAEAKDVYAQWVQVTDQFGASPKEFGEEERTQLYRIGGDPAARDAVRLLYGSAAAGTAQRGTVRIVSMQPESVKLQVGRGEYPEVKLTACNDASKVSSIFVATGKPAGSRVGPPKFLVPVVLWLYEGSWHVVRVGDGKVGKPC